MSYEPDWFCFLSSLTRKSNYLKTNKYKLTFDDDGVIFEFKKRLKGAEEKELAKEALFRCFGAYCKLLALKNKKLVALKEDWETEEPYFGFFVKAERRTPLEEMLFYSMNLMR